MINNNSTTRRGVSVTALRNENGYIIVRGPAARAQNGDALSSHAQDEGRQERFVVVVPTFTFRINAKTCNALSYI